MSAQTKGQKDADVLAKLRQFGLHPAVRVFACEADRTWTKRSIIELVGKVADHGAILRLVTGNRTA